MPLAETHHRPDLIDPFPGASPQGPDDNWSVLWRRKLVILGVMIAAAAAAFGVSQIVDEKYEASAKIRVVVPPGGSADPQGAVGASNDLARQYAQLADSAPVVAFARKQDGGAGIAGSDITGSVVADQNIVSVAVSAPTPALARTRANAASEGLVDFVDRANGEQAERVQGIIRVRLRPLDEQIRSLQARLRRPPGGSAAAQENRTDTRNDLSSLLAERARARIQIAEQVSGVTPGVQTLAEAGSGTKTQPKPALYMIGAVLIAALVAAQLCLVAARRRR